MAEIDDQKPMSRRQIAAHADKVASIKEQVCEHKKPDGEPKCFTGDSCSCEGRIFTNDRDNGVLTMLVASSDAAAEAARGANAEFDQFYRETIEASVKVGNLTREQADKLLAAEKKTDEPCGCAAKGLECFNDELSVMRLAAGYYCEQVRLPRQVEAEGAPECPNCGSRVVKINTQGDVTHCFHCTLDRYLDRPDAPEPEPTGQAALDDLPTALRDAGFPEAADQVQALIRTLVERADQPKIAGTSVDLVTAALSPIDFAIAAAERQMLSLGVPVEILIRWAMQHAASLCAVVPNPAIRAELMKQAIGNFPTQVRNAVTTSRTTTGGIIRPGG